MCDFNLLARASAPTPTTISEANSALELFFEEWQAAQKNLQQDDPDRKVPAPVKFHMCTYWGRAAEGFGPVNEQVAQQGEKLHSSTTKPAAGHSNFNRATIFLQMADWVGLTDALQDIMEELFAHYPSMLHSFS